MICLLHAYPVNVCLIGCCLVSLCLVSPYTEYHFCRNRLIACLVEHLEYLWTRWVCCKTRHHRRMWCQSLTKKCQQWVVEGKLGGGRSRKTWLRMWLKVRLAEERKEDVALSVLEGMGLRVDDTRDRQILKGKLLVKRLSRASMENRH